MKTDRQSPSISAIAKQHGISYSALHHLVRRGRTLEEAIHYLLNKPIPKVLAGSRFKSIKQLASEVGLPYNLVKHRLYNGWPIEAVHLPVGSDYKPASRGRFIDLTGKVFGHLHVLQELPEYRQSGNVYWWCVCDCGVHIARTSKYLNKYGDNASCGCIGKSKTKERNKVHGLSHSPLYKIYHHMQDRCYNRNNADYKYYGGRGIYVCDEWRKDFTCFYKWAMEHGYNPGLTIERISTDGPYAPENCCWLTIQEQQYNRHKRGYLNQEEYVNSKPNLRSRVVELFEKEDMYYSLSKSEDIYLCCVRGCCVCVAILCDSKTLSSEQRESMDAVVSNGGYSFTVRNDETFDVLKEWIETAVKAFRPAEGKHFGIEIC